VGGGVVVSNKQKEVENKQKKNVVQQMQKRQKQSFVLVPSNQNPLSPDGAKLEPEFVKKFKSFSSRLTRDVHGDLIKWQEFTVVLFVCTK
jgi:hypothetical protein